MELIAFMVLGFVALVSASLLVFVFKNPVYGAMSLIVTLIAMAGLFILLDAHFLGAIQVMVYAGAIMVLFLFVTMLLNLQEHELGGPVYSFGKGVGIVASLFLTGVLCVAFMRDSGPVSGFNVKRIDEATMDSIGTVESVGNIMFGQYLLPFELTSVLILAAIIASVVVAKKRI